MQLSIRDLVYIGEVCLTSVAVGAVWFAVGAVICIYPLWAAAFVLSAGIVVLVNVV